MLKLQLAVLRHEPALHETSRSGHCHRRDTNKPTSRWCGSSSLSWRNSSPKEWWQDVTVVMLEQVRKEVARPRSVHREAEPKRSVHGLRRRDRRGGDVVRSSRNHTAGGHGALQGEGSCVSTRPPGPHRYSPAPDEQAADTERLGGRGEHAGGEWHRRRRDKRRNSGSSSDR